MSAAAGRVVRCPPPSSTPTNLVKAYKVKGKPDFLAVDGLSFEVAPGESFGLLGPNGAGKSTTMKMVGAVSTRTSGDLSILGLDPDQYGPEIRSRLGVVPQQDNLDGELNARENLYVYGRYFGLPGKVCHAEGRRAARVRRSSKTRPRARSTSSRAA